MNAMETTTLISAVLPALLIGLNQALKTAGLDAKFIPIFSGGVGIVAGVFLYESGRIPDLFTAIVVGLGAGLAAVGLFSGGATTAAVVKARFAKPDAPLVTPPPTA